MNDLHPYELPEGACIYVSHIGFVQVSKGKHKQPGYKKVRGRSEATLYQVISNQRLISIE